jgi:hypothetical protein
MATIGSHLRDKCREIGIKNLVFMTEDGDKKHLPGTFI